MDREFAIVVKSCVKESQDPLRAAATDTMKPTLSKDVQRPKNTKTGLTETTTAMEPGLARLLDSVKEKQDDHLNNLLYIFYNLMFIINENSYHNIFCNLVTLNLSSSI